eukprot:1180274-Prorocentrum_minimum.AAC.1
MVWYTSSPYPARGTYGARTQPIRPRRMVRASTHTKCPGCCVHTCRYWHKGTLKNNRGRRRIGGGEHNLRRHVGPLVVVVGAGGLEVLKLRLPVPSRLRQRVQGADRSAVHVPCGGQEGVRRGFIDQV